jgi:glycosyltransferase involved in cell wall biosynthesis
MKKIAIDIRALQDKRHSGVQEYLLNLLDSFFKNNCQNDYILFYTGLKKQKLWTTSELIKKYDNVSWRSLKLPNKFLSFVWRFFNWPNLDKFLDYPDIFFAPNLNILPQHILKKTVITFHDLSFERFPEFFSLKSRLWHKFIRPSFLAREAKKIISVSSSTKQDIVSLYKVKETKIQVIKLGRQKDFKRVENKLELKKFKEKLALPNKFLLYLGTLEPRKNIQGILEAYFILRRSNKLKDYKLVLAGSKGWLFKRFFNQVKKSSYANDIIFTGAIKREDRASLYSLAQIFIYPSFLEGFGLPPLEAMACKLPVITSNRSSLSEVVHNAAIMIDPYRVGQIAWAIEELLNNVELYQKFQEEGYMLSKNFDWEKTAQKTLDFLIS